MAKRKAKGAARSKRTPEGLPDAELEVLACLWQKRQATARETREAMAPYRPMTHGAMVTLLKRLEGKGLVSKAKAPVGKAFVYTPTQKPEPVYRRLMRDLHERIFGGSGVKMFASLLEARPPSADELAALQTLLDELRQKTEQREADR